MSTDHKHLSSIMYSTLESPSGKHLCEWLSQLL